MAGALKSKVSTYEFSLYDIRELIAKDIDVHTDAVTVHYTIQDVGGDPMDRYPGVATVVGINVTVTH